MSITLKINEYKSKGISVLEKLTENELAKMIRIAKEYYENAHILFTDNEYDILLEFTERKFPMNKVSKEVGAPVKKNKVKLPFEMASMDKIKPDTNALSNWCLKYKGPYVISCKLDGVSGLYFNDQGTHRLYTRGDGMIGQDISHLLPVLSLPSLEIGEAVRGEFILSKKIFEEKYQNTFSNARNLVSGIINSKTVDEKTKDLSFVTYEFVHPPLLPRKQLETLQTKGFRVVSYQMMEKITNDGLSAILLEMRSQYEYEIDGIIVTDNHIYNRSTGNPEHAFAFKMVISDQLAEAKVVDVIWTPSKDGYLKPRVRIEPIQLNGVNIEYATGFNGKFIEENRIGLGAVIQLVRSGDVIPYIQTVTVPSEKPKMPDVPYHWTDTHVDIILNNMEEDTTVREKMATLFFVSLGVEGLSSGNIHRLFNKGFDSVPKIIKMTKEDFETIDGFKSKMVEKISTNIREKIRDATLIQIIVASNKLGRGLGERKIRWILEKYPDILTKPGTNEQKNEWLQMIKGIGPENATDFVSHISEFLAFLKDCGLENKLYDNHPIEKIEQQEKKINKNHPLYQKKIVMTKIRDKKIIDMLPQIGATLEDQITKETFILIVKSKEDQSKKMEVARKNGTLIMTPEEFIGKYF
jgi:NAD-dependent DNA ligase